MQDKGSVERRENIPIICPSKYRRNYDLLIHLARDNCMGRVVIMSASCLVGVRTRIRFQFTKNNMHLHALMARIYENEIFTNIDMEYFSAHIYWCSI